MGFRKDTSLYPETGQNILLCPDPYPRRLWPSVGGPTWNSVYLGVREERKTFTIIRSLTPKYTFTFDLTLYLGRSLEERFVKLLWNLTFISSWTHLRTEISICWSTGRETPSRSPLPQRTVSTGTYDLVFPTTSSLVDRTDSFVLYVFLTLLTKYVTSLP